MMKYRSVFSPRRCHSYFLSIVVQGYLNRSSPQENFGPPLYQTWIDELHMNNEWAVF